MKKFKELLNLVSSEKLRIELTDDAENIKVIGALDLLTEEHRTLIREFKPQLIGGLKKAKRQRSISSLKINPVPEAESYVLSDAQKRMWIVSQNEEASVAYNTYAIKELSLDLDKDCFEKAIHMLVARHEALRTVFRPDVDGEIKQVVLPSKLIGLKLNFTDLSNENDPFEQMNEIISNDVLLSFDLTLGPLFRVHLFRVGMKRYQFYFNIHHIVGDGVTMQLIEDETMKLYEALRLGFKVSLPELRIQYKDYSVWQIDQISNGNFDRHKHFWKSKLEGLATKIDLPGIKLRPEFKTFNGRSLGTYISADVTEKLKQFAQGNGGSNYSTALAALDILLFKLTGERDIAIGSPVAGRNHDDLKSIVGNFVNTVVVRNTLNPEESFSAIYRDVNNAVLETLEHQIYPYDRVVENLNLKVDFSRNQLFDIMFSYHNYNSDLTLREQELTNEEVNEIRDNGRLASKLDILFNCYELGNYFYLDINYNTDVYDRETMSLFLKQYKYLLSELLSRPEEGISQINHQANALKNLKSKNLQKLKLIKK